MDINDGSEFVRKLEVESREVFVQRQSIVDALKLRKGMRVVDVGAGTGLFMSVLAAAILPGGHLTCTDISPKFVAFLQNRRAQLGLSADEVEVTLSGHTDVPVKSPADLVLLAEVYHHVEHPPEFLSAVRSALRPGGSFVVIDGGGHVRLDKQVTIQQITSNGFKLAEEIHGLLKDNFILRFESC